MSLPHWSQSKQLTKAEHLATNKSFEIQFTMKFEKLPFCFHIKNHNQTTFQHEAQPFVKRKRLGSVVDYLNIKKFKLTLHCSHNLWCFSKELILLKFKKILVWCYAMVYQLITLQNFCAHLKRVPAECSNASYCESSANKTSCMSSWCALLPESHRLCGKLFIFPAVSSLRTSAQLL